MKRLFEKVNKVYSISHEILKAEHECKDKIKSLTKEDKKLLRNFEGSIDLVIQSMAFFKAALFVMLKN